MSRPSPPTEEPEAPLPPGTVVDEYVVEELFSQGLGSSVYRTRQPSLDRTVALKLLPRRRSSDERWVDQFRRGARMLAQISHPNIVPVYGVGTFAGREFLAMMFVPGGKALDRAYPPPQTEAALAGLLKAGSDVARALAFVHEQGLVHGDVKPSNVLVAPNGHAYLIDFDFALRRGERSRLVASEDRSSGFIAPEIFAAETFEADPRGDVYALGATLYAALAGGPPRRGGTPHLGDVRPDLPKPVTAVVTRCLDADRSRRFAEAREVSEALAELVDTLAQPGPGRALGPFDIKAEVGRGGMGVVYRAVQQPLGREVALKVLPPEFTALPSRVKRFQREAEAVSKLDHPHIVPLYDFGRAGGYHYFAMKFVRGSTISAIVERMRGRRKEGMPQDQAFALEFPSVESPGGEETVVAPNPAAAAVAETKPAPQAGVALGESSDDPAYVRFMTKVFVASARAVAHAHAQGILHRDLKPANIIIEDGGHPYLLDFGLARDTSDLELTDSGGYVGTPYYMAPEQIRKDEARPVDCRTDVWGLGVTIYETLALRRPFEAKSADELFVEIRTAEPAPLRRTNAVVSRELEAVVSKALQRDPAKRYQDMESFALDLEATLEGRPVTARPVSALQQIVSQAGRHRVPTGVAVLAAFLIALGAVVATPPLMRWFERRAASRSSGANPAVVAELPRGVAMVVRIFEDPADPAKPQMHAIPAVWFGEDATAVFPVEAAPDAPKGFNGRIHGQLIWILPQAKLPASLDDPALYAAGGGIPRNLDRFRASLPAVVDAVGKSSGKGMCELLPARARWIGYRLMANAPKEGASTDVEAAFQKGFNLPVKYVEWLPRPDQPRTYQLDEQFGALQINEVPRAVLGEDEMKKYGWIIVGEQGVYGYLRKGGFFVSLREMRGSA